MKLRASVISSSLAGVFGLLTAGAVNRWAPFPSAEVFRGSEEAFALGLHDREMPPRSMPMRWTKRRTLFRFRHVPQGPLTLHVRIQGQRKPVLVGADGLVVASLAPDVGAVDVPLTVRRASTSLDVMLRTDGFVPEDGRVLGAQLGAVSITHARSWLPDASLALSFVVPAIACCVGALLVCISAPLALLLACGISIIQGFVLVPCGVVRSPYAWQAAWMLAIGAVLGAALSRAAAQWLPRAAGWSYVALLATFVGQGLLATSPLLVVTDVLFQKHMLHNLANEGDWFRTSVTQHARPFRIPYGISFFAILAPFARARYDLIACVRWGASVAGMIASWGLLLMLAKRSPRWAALAVVVLQLLPGTFVPFAQGNLSNVFGQAMTTLVFAWWVSRPGQDPRRRLAAIKPAFWSAAAGATLVLLAALAHFSSFIVVATLIASLLLTERAPERRRQARWALAGGLAAAVAYYACFAGLVIEQIPRLLELGGSSGPSLVQRLQQQLQGMLWEWWGAPVLALAWIGRPRGCGERLDAALVGYWAAGAILFLAAVTTPLEVRYLYALTVPLAIGASRGLETLLDRGMVWRVLGYVLFFAQGVFGVMLLSDRLLL